MPKKITLELNKEFLLSIKICLAQKQSFFPFVAKFKLTSKTISTDYIQPMKYIFVWHFKPNCHLLIIVIRSLNRIPYQNIF